MMKPKEKDLNLIIDKLCEGKGEEYKSFVKKMIISMSEGDKWENLSELTLLTEKLKEKQY